MNIAKSLDELQNFRSELKGRIGFVPTMGALHEGHLSLVEIAKEHADHVIVSVFVNPTQFAPHEDFDSYPRDLEADAAKLADAGVDLVYFPSEANIYPEGPQVTIKAGETAKGLESDFRPHFFDGVVTVVHKLFEQVRPDKAVFGEKDFQQLQVIKEMVEAESLGIEIIGAPIARDEFGLALSSRNAYLSEAELEVARMLNQAIYNAAHRIAETPDDEATILAEETQSILRSGFDKVDYLKTFKNRVLVAAWLGKTRLIDNVAISSKL